ncbi:NYN domain-containing protein [Cellulomonas triticagri]|uniref:NYN domain-containing protein n=1 Tax=Cellulomonas triticagri TaxID=2483352 RepID=UPI001315493D|nr:NYN domain-containing protein [Cellulomonas triticagri]
MGDLRAVVVVDYQNVHLTGHHLFDSTRHLPKHETLVDPLLFGAALIQARNAAQRPGMAHAVLHKVLVYRGLPAPSQDPDGYARNLAQRAHWERDPRVEVTLRPLKYEYARAADGRPAADATGRRAVVSVQEKGVDVLCALALVRESQEPGTDLVVLASSDSDLAPALDEVRRLGGAKVETCCWYDREQGRGYQLHPTDRSRPVWNTRLDEEAFRSARDRTRY